MRMILNLRELVGLKYSSGLEDAVQVYDTIHPLLKNGRALCVDTTGCQLSRLFLREAFCRLYSEFPAKRLDRLLVFRDRNPIVRWRVRKEIRYASPFYARLHPDISGNTFSRPSEPSVPR